MIKELYYWFHKKTSRSGERGEYSAGAWPAAIRDIAVKACLNRTGKLLDAGCGEGLFISRLLEQKLNMDIYGIDLCDLNLQRARERLAGKNIHLVSADAGQTGFENNFFDTAVCNNLFIMLPSDTVALNVLREMHRVLKPGGKIIFEIRNRLNPLVRLKYKLAPLYDATVKDHPLMTYTPGNVKAWLSKIGFKTTRMTAIGFPLMILAPIITFEAEKC